MSDIIARAAMERMHMQPAMVDKDHVLSLAANLSKMAAAEDSDHVSYEQKVKDHLCMAYGFDKTRQSKPFAFQDGIAVIPIHGSLINRFGSSWGFVTGYNYIQRMRSLALADDDVEAIFYDIHSGGGEVSGAFETARGTFEARGTKPQIGIVDHACYSAAFMQAAGMDKIYVTPTGGAGSIGVYTMHIDLSGLLEKMGIKIDIIHSGDHKVDGHPYAALPKEVRADIQARVDKTRTNFVELVAEYRGLSADAVRKTEGRCYDAEQALELGLIDGIMTPGEAVQKFLTTDSEDITVTDKTNAAAAATTQAPAAQAAAATVDENGLRASGAKAERERISAIMGCDEAKGRSTLANHIAFNTSMSVDDAKSMLAASPAEAAAPAPAKAENEDDPLAAAMAKTEQPKVGADAAAAAKAEDGANALMADFNKATGRTLN